MSLESISSTPVTVKRQKRLRLNSRFCAGRFGRLSLLLKRFGPAMMDSLNKCEFVNLAETLEHETQVSCHCGAFPGNR